MLPSKLYIIFSTYHEAIRKASYDLILYQESCPHGNISFTLKKKIYMLYPFIQKYRNKMYFFK